MRHASSPVLDRRRLPIARVSTTLRAALDAYAGEIARLAQAESTTEPTYYPAIKSLLDASLAHLGLRLDVRATTSESRRAGGRDAPDFAVYDGAGGFVVLYVEVKGYDTDIRSLAASRDRDDQIGRYLAATGAVLLCTIREFAVVTPSRGDRGGRAVPPEHRQLSSIIELWPTNTALRRGARISDERGAGLAELVEDVVTRHAPIASPETLARVLARQARRATADLPEQFTSAVASLQEDFAAGLGITFEGEEGEHFFRSSLVQTVFYGIFAGWLLHASEWHVTPGDDFDWRRTGEYLRIPFLAGLFHEIGNPVRLRELGLRAHLETAAATLGRVDKVEFFRRLRPTAGIGGDEEGFTSAIVYFYEPFLAAFDPTLREELGVWYTPPEIVRYQVRRIDKLLRDELQCPRGLADESVVVLDPACGTGAYLIETLRCIAETLRAEGVQAELAATLRSALEHRIRGFEILTAPFVVAHLQLYLLLSEMGAAPDETHRAGVFLTNALTGWHAVPQTELHFPELQQERDAAQRVKREARIVVVLGNPPYNRFIGAPMHEEASLVDPYKGIRRDARGKQMGQSELWTRWNIRKQLLDDLYIRFFRLAEESIGIRAEFGIVSYISNSSFLTGRSHPIMRESLLGSFDSVWIDNLNGDKYKTGKIVPEGKPGAGSVDASVFVVDHRGGIQVGTAITTWLKRQNHERSPTACLCHVRDFWGDARKKRQALLDSLELAQLPADEVTRAASRPEGPRAYTPFETSADKRWKLLPYDAGEGYEAWPSVDQLLVLSSAGVNMNRGLDQSVVDFSRVNLADRMREYFTNAPNTEFFERHPDLARSYAGYDASDVRDTLRNESAFRDDLIVPYEIFPLDLRWLYYEPSAHLLNRPRPEIAANLTDNEFLVLANESRRASETKPLLTQCAFDLHLFDVGAQCFFAERRERVEQALEIGEPQYTRVANLHPRVWSALSSRWQLHGTLADDGAKVLTRELFRVALAIGHSPAFQRDFFGSLAHDWLHLPVPRHRPLFSELASAGNSIAILLDPLASGSLVRSTINAILPEGAARLAILGSDDDAVITEEDLRITVAHYGSARGGWVPRAPDDSEPWNPVWGERTGDLWLNDRVLLKHVPERVWRLELGGYPVIKKWLGYREARRRGGKALTLLEKDYLRTMVQRLAALLALEPRLDELYARASASAFTAAELGLEV